MTQPCRACGGSTTPSFTLHSTRHGVEVPTWRCRSCVAHFSNGGPVHYDVDLTSFYATYADAIRSKFERIFSFVETLVEPGRFMDVGTGMGYSIEVASRRGWAAAGIEPNAALAKSALERGLTVQNGYLGDDSEPVFDVVLIDNVLEHVLEPADFLRKASKLMAPGTLLVVAIPPIDWLRRAAGAFPFVRNQVTAPQINVFKEVDEHVNMMGRRAMSRLVDQVGLRIEPTRFHHSPVFRNPVARLAGLDDGYYFIRAV